MKGLTRLALIASERALDWPSCRSISCNLKEAYRRLNHFEVREFTIREDMTDFEHRRLLDDLRAWNTKQISFIDYEPHPGPFLNFLIKDWKDKAVPAVNFHLYGNFLPYGRHWLNLEKSLTGWPVRWIYPSRRHRNLLSSFISNREALFYCPFPIKAMTFAPNLKIRQSIRRKLGLTKKQRLFIYTGRLSRQKNIAILLETFASAVREFRDHHPHLLLVGRADERGALHFGIREKLGSYDRLLVEVLRRHQELSNRIHWVDQRGARELAAYYQAADIFISLSTHHDEDFGMSPLEALSSGTRAILSRWGGFDDFGLVAPGSVSYVPVRTDRKGLHMDRDDIRGAFAGALEHSDSADARRTRSAAYLSRFGIDNVASQFLSAVLNGPTPSFDGFRPIFAELTPASGFDWEHGRLFDTCAKSSVYHQIYGSYFE